MFKRIRDLREDHDYTQKEVANKLNMSPPQYQRYESGVVTPPIDVLVFLADLYNVSVDYLVDRTNIKDMFQKNYESEPADIKRCITYFRELEIQNKDIIMGTMASLVKEQNATKSKKKNIG
ncbi:MAG: helix-turn-helix domain-containing protein [Lachnospiraceae bacterium]|nr:helix-turn-helix domain-containing protein [Lachnospiraceae bacterium]